MKKCLLGLLLVMMTCRAAHAQKELTDYLRPAVFSLTMVMVHDVVNPPAASRYYAYALLGAYDLVAQHDAAVIKPGAFVQHYPADSIAGSGVYDYRIAAAF